MAEHEPFASVRGGVATGLRLLLRRRPGCDPCDQLQEVEKAGDWMVFGETERGLSRPHAMA